MTPELKETLVYLLRQEKSRIEEQLRLRERWQMGDGVKSKDFERQIEQHKCAIKLMKLYTKELKQLK